MLLFSIFISTQIIDLRNNSENDEINHDIELEDLFISASQGDIKIYNADGMEVYIFSDDESFGTISDLTVDGHGNSISRKARGAQGVRRVRARPVMARRGVAGFGAAEHGVAGRGRVAASRQGRLRGLPVQQRVHGPPGHDQDPSGHGLHGARLEPGHRSARWHGESAGTRAGHGLDDQRSSHRSG